MSAHIVEKDYCERKVGLEQINPKPVRKIYRDTLNNYDTPDSSENEDVYEFEGGISRHFDRVRREWAIQDAINSSFKGSGPSTLALIPFMFMMRVVSGSITLFVRLLNAFTLGKISVLKSSHESLKLFEEVSSRKRKEAGMVFFFLMLMPLGAFFIGVSIILLLFPLTTLPMLAYLIHIFFYDESHENGSRNPFMRYWNIWIYFVEYFPIRLVKTVDLDPSRKYLFCYHPHGICSFGAFGNFATDATGFSRLFPGIDLKVATLDMNFKVPFLREYLLSLGACSCSKRACNKVLQRGPGSSFMIVVGGADESLLAKPGTFRLNVNKRKGFVRVAAENQVDLVPVLGFGETDAFRTQTFPKDSFGRKMQDLFKEYFGFATPIFWGRDATNPLDFGFMPHRTPIIAVIGKPIPCPIVPDELKGDTLKSTPEGRKIVDDYHKAYIRGLRTLYNTYKNKWALNRSESILILGRKDSRIPANVGQSA